MLKCSVCGKTIQHSKYIDNIICSAECYSANFWLDILKDKDNLNRVFYEHKAYWIGDEAHYPGEFRGFDGAKYDIEFKDGRKVTTTNLWFNGEIPEAFWSLLPDNVESME